MNVRKLLARLNPKSPRFGQGSGGIPEMTPQDIAAALGMTKDRLGTEIFCFAWWPDGATLKMAELHAKLKELLMTEYSARYQKLASSKLELHLLEISDSKRRSKDVIGAQRAVDELTATRWPSAIDKYDGLISSVLTEICAPRHCTKCQGRGVLTEGELVKSCDKCGGAGIIAASKLWRASQLGIDESTYRARWANVYEWLYEIAASRESNAAQQIQAALGIEDAKAA